MFDKDCSYLSNYSEIVRVEWTGQSFSRQFKFFGVDFVVKCDCLTIQNRINIAFNAKFYQGECFYANNFYRLHFQNNNKANDIRSYSIDLLSNTSPWVQIQLSPESFVQDWCEDINGKKYLTFYLWKTSDPNKEKKILKVTNAVIDAENKSFPVNIVELAKVSEIISNMISDLKNLNDNVNLSTFFENFSATHIHMYLCFAHNPNFQFFLLHDIVEVLKICVKLDSKFMIDQIMNIQDLAKIVRVQMITDPEKSENPCYVKNLLEFAEKHVLRNLVVCCLLADVSVSKENKNYPTYMQKLGAYYMQL